MASLDLNRRRFLGTAAVLPLRAVVASQSAVAQDASAHAGHNHGDNIVVGEVDYVKNGFDPHAILTNWDIGTVSTDASGRRICEWTLTAVDHEFEVAPGVTFAGWSYNGRIQGPTLRCTEGERLRIRFVNGSTHLHSMHFHGIHHARMDGVPGAGMVEPGGEFVYEFDAKLFGCHHYHCHAIPLKRHIHKGLYGAFIIDPDPALHPTL
ncbi:MAG: copper oxidase, partial [Alphaproteobacteria bacterium]|nr:copper oxidase [Alphaproteobacteria bacterium]